MLFFVLIIEDFCFALARGVFALLVSAALPSLGRFFPFRLSQSAFCLLAAFCLPDFRAAKKPS